MLAIFSTANGFTVTQNPDGTLSWSGIYDETLVKSVLPVRSGDHSAILLDPDANLRSIFFENLLCIDQAGTPIWKAKLPTSPDVFVTAIVDSEGIWATTWSGFRIQIDKYTGIGIQRVLVK
jgi:outer membrane protein assembly factor BamB